MAINSSTRNAQCKTQKSGMTSYYIMSHNLWLIIQTSSEPVESEIDLMTHLLGELRYNFYIDDS